MGERPMWKPKHRLAAADRSGLRYPSDLIDPEWTIIEPMIPPAKHGGRKRTIDVREILNGIFYVLSTGCGFFLMPGSGVNFMLKTAGAPELQIFITQLAREGSPPP